MTVNHDVVGSSPTGGAKTENHPVGWFFVLFLLVLLQSIAWRLTVMPLSTAR